MTKWHAHIPHVAKHMNMLGGPLWWGALGPGPCPPVNPELEGFTLFVPAWHIVLAMATWDRMFARGYWLSQACWHPLSIFSVSGGGNLSTDSSVRRQKRFQSALRKFQSFTGSLWTGTLSLGGVIRVGRCCDRGNFPRTRLSDSRLSWPKLAKAKVWVGADVPPVSEKTGRFLWVIQQSKFV